MKSKGENKIMKLHKHLYAGFIFLILLVGCSNESPVVSNSSADESFLTAIINGEEFSSSLQIVTFKVSGQTHLATADNKLGVDEYEFALITQNDKDKDPSKMRYGFIELKGNSGDRKKDKVWQLPNNFEFALTADAERHIEGTFSFTAKEFMGNDQLVVTNGKFRANKKGGYGIRRN